MRKAEITKVWEKLLTKSFPVRLTSVAAGGTSRLLGATLKLDTGITVLCGANGVGKSTFLRLIRGALGHAHAVSDVKSLTHLVGAQCTVLVSNKGTETPYSWYVGTDPSSVQPGVGVTLLDPVVACTNHIRLLGNHENVNEVIQSLEPNVLKGEEVGAANFILGRQYTRIEVFEITDYGIQESDDSSEGLASDDEDLEVTPYFIVQEGGAKFDSLSMGMGELAVHYMMWILRRVGATSILIIEEPETFLAPFSQVNFMHWLANVGVDRGLWTIVVTHSHGILCAVPLACIRLVRQISGVVQISVPSSHSEMRRTLGVELPVRLLVLVEDRAAMLLFRALLVILGFTRIHEVDVEIVGDTSSIAAVVGGFQRQPSRLRVLGVFDGNERGADKGKKANLPVTYLPGNLAPEELLKEGATNNAKEFADQTRIDIAKVDAVLTSSCGLNHHDWLPDVAKALGMSIDQLVYELTKIVAKNPDRNKEASELLEMCNKLLDEVTVP